MTLKLRGKVSWFGGPQDDGVDADENLAFITEVAQQPSIFLKKQPKNTTGLARRLDPKTHYIACRWDYDETPAFMLLEEKALVRSPKTKKVFLATPADWGPHEDTGRIADISPGLMEALGITTDDEVEVLFPAWPAERPERPEEPAGEAELPYPSIVISSGHGLHVRGASGILDEVDEARRVVERTAEILRTIGVEVVTFHDDTSHDQTTNLHTIVDFHNEQSRQLDVSIHFNANVETEEPMGTECLFLTQEQLADEVAAGIAEASGLKDRGPKERGDLYFLNHTDEPAILVEVCFVDSAEDATIYNSRFDEICAAIANVLSARHAPVA